MKPQRSEADTVLEKLPIWITRDRPSKAASRGAAWVSRSQKMSSSTITRSELSASFRMRCATSGDSVAPVGLWMAELVMYRRGEWACSASANRATSGPCGV